MKSVLISIQPKWCELIASGKKTVEVRKTKPKLDVPFKCYIYQTKESKRRYTDHRFNSLFSEKTSYDSLGKVIGEFVCYNIETVSWISNPQKINWREYYNEETCLTNTETYEYTKGNVFYEWHISDLVIYDKPKELGEFNSYNCSVKLEYGYPMPTHEIKRTPQSWCYVEG